MTKNQIRTVIFTVASCALGALVSLVAGPIGAVIVIAAVGCGFACYGALIENRKSPPVVAAEVVPVDDDAPIPPDRIDSLTGLANENGLMAWFTEKSARLAMEGKGIIVLTADLAEFEQIERKYDKAIVNAVLIEVARRVATCTGDDGIAARTQGDEFAAVATVVPIRSEEVAADQAGKLAELIQRPVELPTGVIWIGGSVGAAWGEVSDGAHVLLNAREALKKAIRLGRGHYVVYNPEKTG